MASKSVDLSKRYQKGKLSKTTLFYKKDKSVFLDTYRLVALESGRLSAKELEVVQNEIKRYLKRGERYTFLYFAKTPVTSKPLGIRMGKGKGVVSHVVAKVRPGSSLLSITRVSNPIFVIRALDAVKKKLSVLSKVVINV